MKVCFSFALIAVCLGGVFTSVEALQQDRNGWLAMAFCTAVNVAHRYHVHLCHQHNSC